MRRFSSLTFPNTAKGSFTRSFLYETLSNGTLESFSKLLIPEFMHSRYEWMRTQRLSCHLVILPLQQVLGSVWFLWLGVYECVSGGTTDKRRSVSGSKRTLHLWKGHEHNWRLKSGRDTNCKTVKNSDAHVQPVVLSKAVLYNKHF